MAAKNVTPPMSAPERLLLLLPWLNGDPLTRDQLVRCLSRFLSAGTASDAIGLYASRRGEGWTGGLANLGERDLDRLRDEVKKLLDDTTTERRISPQTMAELPSLRFAIGRTPRSSAKLSQLTREERRGHMAAGAYRMFVTGHARDVLLYQTMRVLTEPGAVALAQCPAPAPGNWSRRCDRWLVTIGRRRGRPAIYCSTACRVRSARKEGAEHEGR